MMLVKWQQVTLHNLEVLNIISNIKFLGKKYSWGYKPKPKYINKVFYNNDHMFYGSLS